MPSSFGGGASGVFELATGPLEVSIMTHRTAVLVRPPHEMQISCRRYKACAHINKRFRFATSDGAALPPMLELPRKFQR